jgi:putative Ca2+/H+ antiporter (TMEM165/GDT1 family)
MLEDIIIPFFAILLAELGDKTQIAVFCLASKTKKRLLLLLGVIFAFIIVNGFGILLGGFISQFFPMKYVKIFSGCIFIIFGIITLFEKDSTNEKTTLKNPFLSGFLIILISELGDKSQIASALFATKYNPFMVFLGVIFALSILSIIAVFLGEIVFRKINKKTISIICAIIFIVIGILCFF